ncbi:hypothetical protein M422DRAFT_26918 [Sphaerobolus stellatus SS14]|nr:hypothetical protein M422DRAFT_26918 [Sphaerobolus stellatus SS14]
MPALSDPEVHPPDNECCPSEERFASTKIFPVIHALKEDVIENIDSALSWEQLTASDVNFAVIRPLVMKYASLNNLAIVYSCLVVRSHFLQLCDANLVHANLNNSRAMLSELLAIKLLRHFADNSIQLVAVLTHSWNPLAGAPASAVEQIKRLMAMKTNDEFNEAASALEMAISTNSKIFLSTPLTHTVVNDIYSGRIVFTTTSHHSLVADNYKQRQIEIYDVRDAPFLDHYRLRVPKYGVIMEMANFTFLVIFFVLCLSQKDIYKLTLWEQFFILFYVAFLLEEYTASVEHGWRIYMANMWNVFDASFIAIGLIYLALRIQGLTYNDAESSAMAFDVLACGACILFPRLAFFAVSNNVIILALRGMIADFIFFMTIAAICFSGLLFTLWELALLNPGNTWTVKSIAWLMTQVWFGNTFLTFQQAESFHPLFGPILMVMFAALSSTLLLTILISILSNTFANINANAREEYLFQFALSTIEGVKSDALFSYQPPFNLLAYAVLAPASCFVSPRTLHTINVFLIRVTSFPILVIIAVYERYIASGPNLRQRSSHAAHSIVNSLHRRVKKAAILEAMVGTRTHDLHEALFAVEASEMSIFEEHGEDDIIGLRAFPSRESLGRHRAPHSPLLLPNAGPSNPSSPKVMPLSPRLPPFTPTRARSRSQNRQERHVDLEPPSPLARMYARRPISMVDGVREGAEQDQSIQDILAGIKKVEHVMESINDLPVGRLRAEIKELQERQTRIEGLLLTLTRGMRGENPIPHNATR